MADGEDAHHARQHESQVRLVASFLPGTDVRVPENEIDLFILCLSIYVHLHMIWGPIALLRCCILAMTIFDGFYAF